MRLAMISILLHIIGAIALLILLAILLVRVAGSRWSLTRPVDEIRFAVTADGFRLALSHYLPRGERRGLPVLLCHGLGANAFSLDLTEERSLARFLRDAGRDVWIVELRGVGASVPEGEWRHRTWRFDDFLSQDLPAAVARVLELTEASALHLVGHSMGGMLGYAYCQGQGADRIRSLTAIASPGKIDHLRRIRPLLRLLVNRRRPLRQIALARIGAWIAGLPVPGRRFFANPANLDPRAMRQALVNLTANVAGGVLAQFARWAIDEGVIAPMEGGPEFDFTEEGLGRIETPTLLLAGTQDRLVPVDSVRHVLERLGSQDKRLVVPGPDEEGAHGYGHGDIVLGDRARDEVFPHVQAWLEQYDLVES